MEAYRRALSLAPEGSTGATTSGPNHPLGLRNCAAKNWLIFMRNAQPPGSRLPRHRLWRMRMLARNLP